MYILSKPNKNLKFDQTGAVRSDCAQHSSFLLKSYDCQETSSVTGMQGIQEFRISANLNTSKQFRRIYKKKRAIPKIALSCKHWLGRLDKPRPPAAEICGAVYVGLVYLHLHGNSLMAQPFVICVTVYLITIHGHKWLHLIRECALSDIHIPTR